jgi:Toprim domain-containing protein
MPVTAPSTDIKSLIERHANVQCVGRPARVRGVTEYHSNCPWCGGTDRFIMRPETGQFTCSTRDSGCGRHGDMIDFLVGYCFLSVTEAFEDIGLDPKEVDFKLPAMRPTSPASEDTPCKGWQETGMEFVARAEHALWHTAAGQEMLSYLRNRKLRDETIKAARLGYVPLRSDGKWYISSFESWGLDAENLTPDQLSRGGVRIPNGILIPWLEHDLLWKLAVKRPGEQMNYGQVMGSAEGLYNVAALQYDQPAMLVEGELDCLSIVQEAADLIHVAATGSTTRGRLSRWLTELSLPSYVLQAFDDDQAGDEGATYWINALSHCIRWPAVYGKDPNEMLQVLDRESLRNWVLWGTHTWDYAQYLDSLPPLPEAV